MKTGYSNSDGIDVGELFKLRNQGDPKLESTGFKLSDGRDFADVFLPYDDGRQLNVIGFHIADGRDITELFAVKD